MLPPHAPSPSSPTPTEVALSAAMTEVEAFARRNIKQSTFWRPFVAIGGNQRTFGLWELIRPLGPQTLLLSVSRPFGQLEPLWVTRPTGIVVLEGRYIATTETPASEDGEGSVIQHCIDKGERVMLTESCKYSIDPIGETCTLLVTRLLPYRGTTAERMQNHTISGMNPDEAQALHRKMQQLLLAE